MLQGTLDEFPLIDVLGILKARNKTGRLDIERQAGRGLIYVRLGEPYYAESSLTRSLIGQKLVDIGAITDMQLRKALDRQAESGDRLGQVLLTHGVISREHIASAVISQIKDALSDLLAWETGEFRWEVGAEVEVEVPVSGGMLSDNGSIPLTPHVVPVTAPEPPQAPPVAQVTQSEEPAPPEFIKSGTALSGGAAPALQIDESPAFEPQVQPQLEVAHSPAAGGGSADEESPPVPFDQTAAEPELHPAVGHETEQQEASEAVDENPSGDEPGEFDGSKPEEPFSSQESYDDASDDEDASDEGASHAEDESRAEVEFHEDDSHPLESSEDKSHPLESSEDESHPLESSEDDSDHDSGDQPHEDRTLVENHEIVEPPHAEIVDSFDGTRVIKSRPAPEFDDEFDQMFVATQELAAEQEAQDDETEPVAEAPSFEAEPTEIAPRDEAPYFEADPVAEASMFETELTETAPLDEAPSFEPEEPQPVDSFDFEVPTLETFESLAAIASEVVTPAPPPPPPMMDAPESPDGPDGPDAPDTPVDESTEIVEQEAPREPAADIKLDRSSLVRELSDLLR